MTGTKLANTPIAAIFGAMQPIMLEAAFKTRVRVIVDVGVKVRVSVTCRSRAARGRG